MSRPVFPARARPVGLLCAAVLLAGCTTAGAVSAARTHSTRTTVPASASTASQVDTAFSTAALRAVDPCALLDQNTVSQLGKTNQPPALTEIDTCSADLDDGKGKDLNVSVAIGGDDLARGGATTGTIAGLPVKEEADGTECVEDLVTQHNPTTGIEVRISYSGATTCVLARQLAGLVVNRIRTNPPRRPTGVNSLVLIDPCGTIDDADVVRLTAVGPDKTVEGLFKCDWLANGYDLSVEFTLDGNPKDDTLDGTPQPVDVGVPAYAFPSTDVFPSCDVKWLVRPVSQVSDAGNGEQGEVVDVQFGDVLGGTLDPCTQAEAAAKLVATKVPHGS